jgi:hypothetical protein
LAGTKWDKKVNKQVVEDLLTIHRRWKKAVDNNSIDRNALNQNLLNHIKTHAVEICEALDAVSEIEAKIVSYEELIERLMKPKAKTKAGTEEVDRGMTKVQTAVVDFEGIEPSEKEELID